MRARSPITKRTQTYVPSATKRIHSRTQYPHRSGKRGGPSSMDLKKQPSTLVVPRLRCAKRNSAETNTGLVPDGDAVSPSAPMQTLQPFSLSTRVMSHSTSLFFAKVSLYMGRLCSPVVEWTSPHQRGTSAQRNNGRSFRLLTRVASTRRLPNTIMTMSRGNRNKAH